MSYIEKNLMPNEKIILNTELHWIIFFWPMVFSFACIWFMFAQKILFILNYFVVLLIVYILSETFIRYVMTTYVLTNVRAIIKRGFIFTRIWDMSLSRIESVQLQQSLFGRIFDYGDVIINGTGGDQIIFNCIESPGVFREKAFEAMQEKKQEK